MAAQSGRPADSRQRLEIPISATRGQLVSSPGNLCLPWLRRRRRPRSRLAELPWIMLLNLRSTRGTAALYGDDLVVVLLCEEEDVSMETVPGAC